MLIAIVSPCHAEASAVGKATVRSSKNILQILGQNIELSTELGMAFPTQDISKKKYSPPGEPGGQYFFLSDGYILQKS